MRILLYLLSYAGLTSLTVYFAALSEQKWRPLPFSEFYLSNSEVLTIALVLGTTTFIVLALGRIIANPQENAKKFSLDYFNYLLAYTVTILYFLLASSITFSPNLFVYIGIYSTVAALLIHLLFIQSTQGLYREVLACIKGLFKRLITLYGVFVLLLFMTPMALAIGFIFSRDVADVITEIRLKFNKAEDVQWALVPAMDNVNFRRPMIARFSAEESNTLYVLERSGKLYRIDYPSGNNKELILNLEDKVGLVDVENGALGLALHPEYGQKSSASYRAAYIYYTSVHNNEQKNIISKFSFNGTPKENTESEQYLMVLERTNDAYHNGGSLEFGPDGFLYIALGEGLYLDKNKKDTSQSLRAGIMRIDVDMQGGSTSHKINAKPLHALTENYYIPSDNPFVGNEKALDEYWVMGLRNPFRVSFDAKNGTLWAGDVGSTVWEEVNKVVKGSNYLYPYIEGPKTSDFVTPQGLVGEAKHPNYTYKHSAFDRAVIGGVVYRGSELPELKGTYIFGDNFSGKLFGIPENIEHTEKSQLIAQALQYAQRGISSITYSPEGEVFVTLLGAKGKDTGQLMKLTSVNNQPQTVEKSEPEEKHVYSATETKSLYLEMCARCHGNEGLGNGPDTKSFDVKIANFTDIKYARSSESIQAIIAKGGTENKLSPYMPPWQFVLSENEIQDLSRFINSLND